ncbi:MAG TPA: hypothetical protein VK611_22470 [Acidimicrobiales bacterium]|nr:hypothetical protein [Acidimicrobiales bacterium]
MTPDPDDSLTRYAAYATELADAVDAALAGWVERSVRSVAAAQGLEVDESALRTAAEAARAEGAERLRALLATDIDEQAGSPLSILRSLVRYPTEVLRAAGARPVHRDEFVVRSFPADVYDLSPAAFADVDPTLHEPGLAWGAAKAYIHLSRRR